ncbi:MAG: hypothetical protein LBP81_08420 [Treponema sp.]|nr:hypothetical protein [Treponema sp.]
MYVADNGTFIMQGGSFLDNTLSASITSGWDSSNKHACGGGVYLDSGSAITKTGGTISAGGLSSSTGNTGGAAVYVNCSTDNPVSLENDVKAEHNLTKAAADTTKSSLTPKNGWSDE